MGLGDRPLQNIRSFLSTRPPLVVFIFCLGMMAVAFVSFAYYIKVNNIRNPDVQKDWNTFLRNLTNIHFCPSNGTLTVNNSIVFVKDGEKLTNVSMDLTISMHLFIPMNSNITFTTFRTVVTGGQMGLSGAIGNTSIELSITPHMPYTPTCAHQEGCLWTMPACLTITAPKEVLPFSPRPLTCHVNKMDPEQSGNLISIVPKKFSLPSECSSVLIKINHEEDERLFVMLTVDSKSRVHSRLLQSSYFLLIVIATILLFGFIRGGRHLETSGHTRGRTLLSRTASP